MGAIDAHRIPCRRERGSRQGSRRSQLSLGIVRHASCAPTGASAPVRAIALSWSCSSSGPVRKSTGGWGYLLLQARRSDPSRFASTELEASLACETIDCRAKRATANAGLAEGQRMSLCRRLGWLEEIASAVSILLLNGLQLGRVRHFEFKRAVAMAAQGGSLCVEGVGHSPFTRSLVDPLGGCSRRN